jgi:hypothetical protein
MDFKGLIGSLGGIAPAIATALGSPAAGLAVSALMKVFGVDTKEQVEEKVAQMSDDDRIALIKADKEFTLEMAKITAAFESKKIDAAVSEDVETTKRWVADSESDERLTRLVRPLTLLYLLGLLTFLVISLIAGAVIPEMVFKSVSDLVGYVIFAYFGLRTADKFILRK